MPRKRAVAKGGSQRRAAGKPVSEKQQSDERFMSALRDFVRTRGPGFLQDPNVTSVGVGYKTVGGKRTSQLAVQFSVDEKVLPERVEALGSEPIPPSFTIDGVVVPTDVVQRKFSAEYRVVSESASPDRKRRVDAVVPGVSVGNVKVSAGTLGCVVYDKDSGVPYVLSNWHVLHGPDGAIGDAVVQPGPHDDNRVDENRMGTLVRSHLGAAGDCAIASIEGRTYQRDVIELAVPVEEIGEPALDDKVIKSGRTTGVTHGVVTRIHTLTKINYGGTIGVREVGGFEIGIDPDHQPSDGEVSRGGDSGSVWLFKRPNGKTSRVMAGLHFAGEGPDDPNEHAVACYPASIFEKLGITLAPKLMKVEGTSSGYDPHFLSVEVAPPALSKANAKKAFKRDGSPVLDYTHFSLTLNKERRFAIWVGWNIDGGSLKKLSRKGLKFIPDPDVPEEAQVGDELYAGNRLDRGHIARRADLLWGPLAEAKRANSDSFYFTNITPQMDDFNQSSQGGIWGALEDAVFNDVDTEDLHVSVFGGPVFRDTDREYRDVKIPRDFWKVIVFVEAGQLKAKGFLLTQNLDALEALDLDAFSVYQVGLGEIETRCGIDFPAALGAADAAGERIAQQAEALSTRTPLSSVQDIDWS